MNVNDTHYHFHQANVLASAAAVATEEETLVADARAGLTPAQMVDRKLASLLESTSLPSNPLPGGRRARPPQDGTLTQ
ncbi:MAG TPA: hypothetical protein VEL76_20070 [Gemmataceae bacterium]|nr:hypothetical protein [Gemmataceae bacterium]